MVRKISLAVNVLLLVASLAYLVCYDAFLADYASMTFSVLPVTVLWVLATPALFFSSAGFAQRLRDWLVGREAKAARLTCAVAALLAGFAPLAGGVAGVPGLLGKTGVALSAALFACCGILFAPSAAA